jgi:AbrB family looped-hinge helix DNA binding protein
MMSTVLVENAKILPKGQVTLPRDIRLSLGLNEGDRVNSAVYAMRVLQEAMTGEAGKAGILSEDDAVDLIAALRRESTN